MNIVMLESLGVSEDVLARMTATFSMEGHTFVPCTSTLTCEEKKARIADADIAIIANGALPGDVIRCGTHLKMISVGFTGIDHMDVAACREMGIMICNAQGYATTCTAEMTVGLMLACLRHLADYDAVTRKGGTKDGYVNRTLRGKTVGIIGTGAIGQYVAKLVQAFGATTIGYAPRPKAEAEAAGISYVDLDTLFKTSDIVTLHAPATAETAGMVSAEKIALMKRDSILINCARGALVDSHALANALNESRIAAAGIDVFEMEPPIPTDHPLLTAKNVIVAPHVGYFTEESYVERVQIVLDNVRAFLDGNPINVKA